MQDLPERALVFFLKSTRLFAALSEKEISFLLPLLQVRLFQPGQWLIREGETGQALFLIRSGEAEILKEEVEFHDLQILGQLGPGDWAGEMAHLEKEPRSASVRAKTAVEALTLSLNELEADPSRHKLYFTVLEHLTQTISRRLRHANEQILQALKDQWKLTQNHRQISKALIELFICIALYINLSGPSASFFSGLPDIYVPSLILIFSLLILGIIWSSEPPLSYYGVTLKNSRKHALEAVLFSLPILAAGYAWEWALVRWQPALQGQSLFADYTAQTPWHIFLACASYFALIPLQELIARGFLQTCLRNFFLGRRRVFLAILTSNIVFEIFHTMKGVSFALHTFLLGLFWGWLYERQRTLVGVSISHILIAGWLLFVLNFNHLLEILG